MHWIFLFDVHVASPMCIENINFYKIKFSDFFMPITCNFASIQLVKLSIITCKILVTMRQLTAPSPNSISYTTYLLTFRVHCCTYLKLCVSIQQLRSYRDGASSDRLMMLIKPATPGLQGVWYICYTTIVLTLYNHVLQCEQRTSSGVVVAKYYLTFWGTVKAAPHKCVHVIRTGQPKT